MRRRILAVAITAAVVATFLFALPLAVAARQLFLVEEQDELERAALRAVSSVDPAFSVTDRVELPKAPAPITLGLYGTDGHRVSGTGPAQGDPAVARALLGQVAQEQVDGQLVTAVPVASGERVVGAVRAQTSMTDMWHRTLATWGGMLALGAVAVLVAVLVARRQARQLSRPLEALAAAAHTLGEGDFAVRTATSGVPEIDETGQALDVTAARLGDLVARERAFTANASHQLRTPLTGLRLGLESALDGPQDDLRAAARDAIASADELEQTIDDVLALSRRPVSPDPAGQVGLDAVASDVQRRWLEPLAQLGRPLRVVVEPGTPPCTTAAGAALRQVLDILVDNALRHGAGPVDVTARGSADALAVDVGDAGTAVDRTGDLFARGYSGAGGSGIGLALARDLVEAQGGRLLLARTAPSTVFTVLLPAPVPEPPPADEG